MHDQIASSLYLMQLFIPLPHAPYHLAAASLAIPRGALTSSLELDSMPTKNAGAPALSITSGDVRLDVIAMFNANLANVKSIEDRRGSLDVLARNLMRDIRRDRGGKQEIYRKWVSEELRQGRRCSGETLVSA